MPPVITGRLAVRLKNEKKTIAEIKRLIKGKRKELKVKAVTLSKEQIDARKKSAYLGRKVEYKIFLL